MHLKKLNLKHIIVLLFLLSVFLLSIIKIEDTDAWMHLSLGRLIWESKGIPAEEQYIYPSLGSQFSYSSWLFGVIYYLSYHIFNIYGVILLKAVTITVAFYILISDSLRPYKNYIVTMIIMSIVVFAVRHRFVERPDTFLMVFLSFSIFSLNAYVYDRKKYIYFLPVVHMIWANCHSSINLMFIPFLAFIIGGILQQLFENKNIKFSNTPTPSQIKIIIIIFLISFAASLISPYFINQYFFGFQMLANPWFKQEILELQKPVWPFTKWLFLISAFTSVSFIMNMRRASIIHFILFVPFVILSLTGIRFMFILAIVTAPIFVRNLSSFLDSKSLVNFMNKKTVTVVVIVWIIFYSSFSLINGTPFDKNKNKFGFGINYSSIPENALKYMDKNMISGNVFNLFHWGGYITWRDFPRRAAFIDSRGALKSELLEKLTIALSSEAVLDELCNKYRFESILIGYPNNITVLDSNIDAALQNPGWALVYWDDLSLVYLKRGGMYDSIIEKNEYRHIKPANGLDSIRTGLRDEAVRLSVMNEIRRNVQETGSSKGHAFLGYAYNETGFYKEAIAEFAKVRYFPMQTDLPHAYAGIAYAYEQLNDLDNSLKYYKKAVDINNDAALYYSIGNLFFKKGDKKGSLEYFKKALELNKNLLSLYPKLVNIYQEFGATDDVKKTQKMFKDALVSNSGENHFKKGFEAYIKKSYDDALDEFKKSIEANPSNPSPYSNIGYLYYDRGNLNMAYEYQKKALDIDPNFANAHYGLAVIFKAWGDLKNEKKHLLEYLKIEPLGYFSRKAEQEKQAIDNSFMER
jgi:tetratricopeptide (TPR) repeat protein